MKLNELLNKLKYLEVGTKITDDKSNEFEVTREKELKVLGVYGLDFARRYQIAEKNNCNESGEYA